MKNITTWIRENQKITVAIGIIFILIMTFVGYTISETLKVQEEQPPILKDTKTNIIASSSKIKEKEKSDDKNKNAEKQNIDKKENDSTYKDLEKDNKNKDDKKIIKDSNDKNKTQSSKIVSKAEPVPTKPVVKPVPTKPVVKPVPTKPVVKPKKGHWENITETYTETIYETIVVKPAWTETIPGRDYTRFSNGHEIDMKRIEYIDKNGNKAIKYDTSEATEYEFKMIKDGTPVSYRNIKEPDKIIEHPAVTKKVPKTITKTRIIGKKWIEE